ncbi:MAG: hypothetical protein K9H61_05000 [Bacteroidia bacterium]|nr:hypothetical protein [Bacteroidia bacterium]MCF8446336.1 hypothetical protein [Bacteroidia bacterium]
MQNLRTVINAKPYSHFGAFSNKCTKGKKSHLKFDTGEYLFAFKDKDLNYMKQVQYRVKYMNAPLDMTKGDREVYKAICEMEYQESEEI